MGSSQPCEIYVARDSQDAHLVKGVLGRAGIEARVVGDQLYIGLGELPLKSIEPRVLVHSEDAAAARKIIASHQAARAHPKPVGPSWSCPQCGETNQASFDICWNCQSDRE